MENNDKNRDNPQARVDATMANFMATMSRPAPKIIDGAIVYPIPAPPPSFILTKRT